MKNNMKNIISILFIAVFTISCNTENNITNKDNNVELSEIIERVEPPNWWVGMKTNDLQILVYGKTISDLQPIINS